MQHEAHTSPVFTVHGARVQTLGREYKDLRGTVFTFQHPSTPVTIIIKAVDCS